MGLGSLVGAGLSLAGNLFGGGGDKGGSTGTQYVSPFMEPAMNKYKDLYENYYWPIEENLAKWYQEDIGAARPYDVRMRDYQLGRGDELVNFAQETNPILDNTKKDLIRRLTEGEDVLANRMRTQAGVDVDTSFNKQRQQDLRSLGMYGINPNSGAFRSSLNNMGSQQATAQAAARTMASRQAEDTSLQRQNQALGLYTNPSRQFDAGTLKPGISVEGLLNAGTNQAQTALKQGSYADAGDKDRWSGISSGVTGIFDAFGKMAF